MMGGCCIIWTDPSPDQIVRCLSALVFALLGGILARLCLATSGMARPAMIDRTTAPSPPTRWSWLMMGIITAPPVFTSAATVGTRMNPGLWAGATFFLTCGVFGMAILGAVFGRGRRREISLGAALFGIGYLALTLGRPSDHWDPPQPSLVTEELVQAARRWFPVVPKSLAATNARLQDALDQPISMPFPNETPLDDVLKYIKHATSTPDYPGISIYVNPLGLQEAERSLNSTVQLDLEGVPLRTTLGISLEQLGLAYSIKGSYVEISSADSITADLEDPLRVVGHCLFAMLAAMIGGAAAPLISDARRQRPAG